MRKGRIKFISIVILLFSTACGAYYADRGSSSSDDPLEGELMEDPEPLLTHCPEPGKVINEDTHSQCCWPGQSWSVLQWRCVGIPRCPAGLDIAGEDCADSPELQGSPVARRTKERRTLDAALGEARECVVQNDQECCLRSLRGVKRNRRVVQILLSCYHQSGRRDAACELAKHHPNIRRARLYSLNSCSNDALASHHESQCEQLPVSKLDLSPVITAYKQNDLEEAISLGFALAVGSELEADRERAMRLARKLDRLATIRMELISDTESGLPEKINQLEELLRLDQLISGGHFAPRIVPELRSAYLRHAKHSWRNGEQLKACQSSVKAYKLAPSSSSDITLAKRCEVFGQELYQHGVKAMPGDVTIAKTYWRRVLSVLPEKSPWYRKAYVNLNSKRGLRAD